MDDWNWRNKASKAVKCVPAQVYVDVELGDHQLKHCATALISLLTDELWRPQWKTSCINGTLTRKKMDCLNRRAIKVT